MEFLAPLIDVFWMAFSYFLNLDKHLAELIQDYGKWVYLILFAIIFCETGLVVTPFLPGDSLLFIAGALAALGGLDVHLMVVLLIVAAILGDAVNYSIGRAFGRRWLAGDGRWIKREHLARTHDFYERFGGATIVVARFVPIVRTYAPFVAGVSEMTYRNFAFYNLSGGVLWVVSLTYLGYFFGNVPVIKENTGWVILGIIAVSLIPLVWGWFRAKNDPAA